MKRLFSFWCAIVMILSTQAVFAQDFTDIMSSSVAPDLGILLSPEYPQPGDVVTATINDFDSRLFGSTITWVLNDREILDAANQRQTTFVAGPLGSTQNIQVIMTTPRGDIEQLNTLVRPSFTDIIIEAQTRTPDFYPGRAVPSHNSVVNATAIVSDETGVLNQGLVYLWRLGREVLNEGPIRGTNQVSFEMPRGKGRVLRVRITTPEGKVVGSQTAYVPSILPEMHFYEVNTLFGTHQKAINRNFSLIGNSATIKAEPYNLDIRVYNDPDIAEWEVAGSPSGSGSLNPYEITFQRTGNDGNANLHFHVRDTTNVLQGARSSIQVNF